MNKTCTTKQDDVIKYVFNEFSSTENMNAETQIIADPESLTFFLDIIDIRSKMNEIKMEPSSTSIRNILNFSRKYQATSI